MMDNAAYSLDKLHDIVSPPEPGIWPPASGVWVALGLVAVLLVVLCVWLVRRRRRGAYRRAGLALLANAATAHDISVVLKRVALVAFPRPEVAPLHGQDWVDFLHRTGPRAEFDFLLADDPRQPVPTAARASAARWIRRHRPSPPVATTGGE